MSWEIPNTDNGSVAIQAQIQMKVSYFFRIFDI